MTQKAAVKVFEALLREIGSYKAPFNQFIEAFIAEYDIDFEPPSTTRPLVRGISTSSVIRDVREGRWSRYT